jgi:hypothetical protein
LTIYFGGVFDEYVIRGQWNLMDIYGSHKKSADNERGEKCFFIDLIQPIKSV